MALSLQALVDSGHLADAARTLDHKRGLSISERVLRAYLTAELERPPAAIAVVRTLLAETLTPRDKAICLEVMARYAACQGKVDEGLALLQQATSLVEPLHDPVAHAHAEATLTLSALLWRGLEPALAALPRLRRLVTRAGDARSATTLHLICGEIEMKRDQWASAEAHLDVADRLLEQRPHLILLGRLTLLRSSLAALRSNPREALRLARAALRHYERAGPRVPQATALGNVAYYSLVIGEWDEAAASLQRSRTLLGPGPMQMGFDATELEIALASPDRSIADRLAPALEAREGRDPYSFYGLWHLHMHARWLLACGRAREAGALLIDAEPHLERLADRSLLTRSRLLVAECFAGINGRKGLELVANAGPGCEAWSLELLGDAARVAGRLTATDDRRLAAAQFSRALRVLASGGYRTAAAAVVRSAVASAIEIDEPRADAGHAQATARGVELTAAVFDLIAHPSLAGHEILALLVESGAATRAALVERTDRSGAHVVACAGSAPPDAPGAEEWPDAVRVPLGSANAHQWEIVAVPPARASGRFILGAVQRLVACAIALREAREHDRARAALWPEETFEQQLGMVFAAQSMIELVNATRRVAPANVTVLITGETGTGKELLARALHDGSPRRERPVIPFNCTAISRDMLDSQLFGYRRGAFTGAQEAFCGVIRAATGGTLFLDEIGELPLDMQPKLLRFLESGEVHPLGEPRPLAVDVRIVAATNVDLEHLVAQARFRDDLFYRLNVVRLQVPPLRERREEIPFLAQHFLARFSDELQKPGTRIAAETMEYLVLCDWPGNVRQLANEIRRLVATTEAGAILMPQHLSSHIAGSRRTIVVSEDARAPSEVVIRMDQPLSAACEHLERAMIQHALETASGRVEEAAHRLGLSRKGLYLKRQRLGIGEEPVTETAKRILVYSKPAPRLISQASDRSRF